MQRVTRLSLQAFRLKIRHDELQVAHQQCNFSTSKSILKPKKMDSTDHLSRTSTNTRDDGIHSMSVKAISKLSPTVKEIVLASEKKPVPFSFKAGQWVDVYIPGVDKVGGFSMISGPQELTTDGFLRLAIKYSTHPPALWMHQQCKVGDELSIRVGGDFYLTHDTLKPINKILLIAGGVGINPLSSMIHYIMKAEGSLRHSTKMHLMYSAKTKNELIFKEAFDNYQKLDSSTFSTTYFLTVENASHSEGFHCRRICSRDLESSINWLTGLDEKFNYDPVDAYICGPPDMIAKMKDDLSALNVKSIHYEKWW